MHDRMVRVKPILKWAGGKQALAAGLVERFPEEIGVYYEPFVGGASVFLTLNPGRAVLGDLNSWLLDTYVAVRDNWGEVAQFLDKLENNKQAYLRIRSIKPSELEPSQRAAHLIYLNKTCFRGLFRVNRNEQFNVPYGDYDRRYYDPVNVQSFVDSLRNVEFRCGDFELTIGDATAKDFIYFDPPYFKLGGYSDFNRYTPGQFRSKDHIRLAAVCRELDSRGVRWAVSNSNTEFVRSLFDGFNVDFVSNRREINLNASERAITELFITNY